MLTEVYKVPHWQVFTVTVPSEDRESRARKHLSSQELSQL